MAEMTSSSWRLADRAAAQLEIDRNDDREEYT